MRLFIAAEIPDKIKKELGYLLDDFKRFDGGVKWVEPDNIHITVYFFGDVRESDYNLLDESLKDLGSVVSPFEVSIKRVSAFPNPRRPRVIWCGVEDSSEMLKKANAFVRTVIMEKGINANRDEREFKAHLTIGRVKRMSNNTLVDKILEHSDASFGSFVIDSLVMFKSTLTRKGPVYEQLNRYNLG